MKHGNHDGNGTTNPEGASRGAITATLSGDEAELLRVYRKTDERGRELIMTAAGIASEYRSGSTLRVVDGAGRR